MNKDMTSFANRERNEGRQNNGRMGKKMRVGEKQDGNRFMMWIQMSLD